MSEDIENQDIDLTGTDISRPLLPRQQRLCRTGEVRVENGDYGRQLIVPLTLEEAAKDTKQGIINPGFVVTYRISLDPKGKRTQQMVNEELARFQVAATDLDKPGSFKLSDLSWACNRQLLVTFDVRPDQKDPSVFYQDVKRVSKPGSPKAAAARATDASGLD